MKPVRSDTGMIESVSIKGYMSIREQNILLSRLNILIGANGAGKSNILKVFTLLSAMMAGNLQEFVSFAGGANALLSRRTDSGNSISFHVTGFLQDYRCVLVPDNRDHLLIQSEELITNAEWKQSPESSGKKNSLESGVREESRYAIPCDTVSLKSICDNPDYPSLITALYCLKAYQMAQIHQLDSPSRVHPPLPLLEPDAGNLACVIADLYAQYPENYSYIRDCIRLAVPFFDDFSITCPDEQKGSVHTLGWREHNTEYTFPMQDLSDGIRRFIVLATILNSPVLPPVIIINEPEAGLHPYAIRILAAMVRSAAVRTQVIIATQSVTFIDTCGPNDLLVVGRSEGETVVTKINDDEIGEWLADYSLGELWEHNIIGGRPDR
ncbi:MAG: AAA family ATPase [Methanospirillaceae archaeon]|nr:AAA family ATPase [Methanospirillaceae archaeon]